MTDIFFSYSSKDRDRVRPIYEALTALDFDVFWDQQVPAGTDWDTWIKEKLTSARSVVVFWSLSSVASDNVRHEATVAKAQSKLVPVILDNLRVDQFPMGLFNTQAARLMDWTGNGADAEWRKLLAEIENKATPAWVNRRFAGYDEELMAERKKREAAQARGDAAHGQLDKEIASHDDLRRGREMAVAEADKARAELSGFKEALEAAKSQNDDLSGRLAAVERMGAAHRSGVPLWAMVLGVMGALVLGAGGIYTFVLVPARMQFSIELDRAKTGLAQTQKQLDGFVEEKAKIAAERVRQAQLQAESEQRAIAEAEQRRIDHENALRNCTVNIKEECDSATDCAWLPIEGRCSTWPPRN